MHTCALREHEAVPVAVERPRRLLRAVVVARAERAHACKGAEGEGVHTRLRAAREHRAAAAAAQQRERLPEGVRAARARGRHACVGATQAVGDADGACADGSCCSAETVET